MLGEGEQSGGLHWCKGEQAVSVGVEGWRQRFPPHRPQLPLQVTADFAMREELVLKIAILAEKFAPNVQW